MRGIKPQILEEISPEDVNSPIVIVGMPGIGNVGKNAVVNSAKSLNARNVLNLFYYDFPAQILVTNDAEIKVPRAEIFFWKNSKGGEDVFFVTGDFQPTTPQGIFAFSDYIGQFAKEYKASIVIATGAYVTEASSPTPSVFVSTTSKKLLEEFKKISLCKPMASGIITGANGVIPVWSKIKYGIEGVCLLAETIPILSSDPKASKAIIQVLEEKFKLGVDTTILDAKIETMERVLSELRDRLSGRGKLSESKHNYIS
ncbi:MAG: PAC2 family protein [Candidatus Odinarchaeia archaeon]